jgi:hypothetical protein
LLQLNDQEELIGLLPESEKQLEYLQRLSNLEMPVLVEKDPVGPLINSPVMLTFFMEKTEAKELNLAIDLVLECVNKSFSRGTSLAHIAHFYLRAEQRCAQ